MKCKKCKTEMDFVDDSFDHEFGTRKVIYWECPKCEHQQDFQQEGNRAERKT